MKIFSPCGFPSAQQLVFFVCYTKHGEALAALALCVAAKSCGKGHVPLASLGEQHVPVDPWQEEEERVQGQTAERVDDMPALPVFILESNCDAAC